MDIIHHLTTLRLSSIAKRRVNHPYHQREEAPSSPDAKPVCSGTTHLVPIFPDPSPDPPDEVEQDH
jgi:hypothetical protein